MQNTNIVIIEGFLADDPKFRSVRDGVEYAAFRLANNQDYKGPENEWVNRAFYSNIVVKTPHDVRAIKARALKKGARVLVEGRLENRTYQGQNNTTHYITEVVVNPYGGKLQFLDPRVGGDDGNDDA